MAYLGNGIYDLLDVIKASKDPSIAYEGLYQDPRRYDTTYYGGDLKTYPYGMTDASGAQALISSAFPQEYGVGSLFNPRIGRPEQSIYYKEPEPADPTSDFYQPIGDPFQIDYPITRAIPKLDTSRFTGVNLESGYLDRAGSYGQDVYSEKPKGGGIAKLFEILRNLPTPFNLARRGLESLSGLNQRLRANDFARSKTLTEYLDRKARAKNAARMAEKYQDFSQRTSGAGATGGDRDFSTPKGKSTSYEQANRAFAASR